MVDYPKTIYMLQAYTYSFVTVYCMNFNILVCYPILFSFSFVLLFAQNPGHANVSGGRFGAGKEGKGQREGREGQENGGDGKVSFIRCFGRPH